MLLKKHLFYYNHKMFFSHISFLTFISSVVMGIIGLALEPKRELNRSFAIFSFIVSVWAFGDIFYYTATDKSLGWFWYRVTSIGWCGMIFGMFYFYTTFAGYYKRIPFIIKALFFIYSIILIIIQFHATLFLKDFHQTPYGLIEDIDVLSKGFFLQYGGMLAAILTGTFFVVKRILETDSKREKKMLKSFIFLAFLSSLLGIGLNVTQAFLTTRLPPMGSIFMLFFIGGILYLIRRYRILKLDYGLLQNETFDMISDLIIIVSPEGKAVKINDAAKEILSPVSAMKNASDFFKHRDEFNKYLSEAVTDKKKLEKQYVLIKGHDKNIPAYLSVCPIFDNFRDYIGSILICKPLTDFEKIAGEYKISPQEKKIIIYLMEGLINKEISIKMNLSESTLKNYITNIYQKTKASNKVELLKLFFVQQ